MPIVPVNVTTVVTVASAKTIRVSVRASVITAGLATAMTTIRSAVVAVGVRMESVWRTRVNAAGAVNVRTARA